MVGRLDAGSKIDLTNLHHSCPVRSVTVICKLNVYRSS